MRNLLLIAEDDDTLRASLEANLERKLRDLVTTIITAASRDEAISALEQSGDVIACVLTDLRLPKFGDGEAIAKAALDRGSKVIVLSGTTGDLSAEVREQCLSVFTKDDASLDEIATLIKTTLHSK